jgi:hypothetical protein
MNGLMYREVFNALVQNDMCFNPTRWSPSPKPFRSPLLSTIKTLLKR